MEDNTTTDVEETLSASPRNTKNGDCDNAGMIEWFQCDETLSIDHGTDVLVRFE